MSLLTLTLDSFSRTYAHQRKTNGFEHWWVDRTHPCSTAQAYGGVQISSVQAVFVFQRCEAPLKNKLYLMHVQSAKCLCRIN